jgi:pimeloyl-ACP methyl ester carboxylesterase
MTSDYCFDMLRYSNASNHNGTNDRFAQADSRCSMETYILIHGSWHGSWCWERVTPILQAAGHRVITPDLPGTRDNTARFTEDVLAQWANFTADLVCAQDEPVILAGHSRGGIVISEAAERVPDRIGMLVYISAFLIRDGETLAQTMFRHSPSGPLLSKPSEDGSTTELDPVTARSTLYQLTSDADFHAAAARFVAEPVGARMTPLRLSKSRFGRVPRAYIESMEDQAINLSLQRAMRADLPCDPVFSLPSDHCPFYSTVPELSAALLALSLIE